MYKVMASNPSYLDANWQKIKTVMNRQGRLDRLTKEIIAVAVSAVSGCAY
jgi:alkylhydroperoxidase/carboxymuconolactone decarboxylase family protein YurZ